MSEVAIEDLDHRRTQEPDLPRRLDLRAALILTGDLLQRRRLNASRHHGSPIAEAPRLVNHYRSRVVQQLWFQDCTSSVCIEAHRVQSAEYVLLRTDCRPRSQVPG
jgi:hypothetical protein